MKPTLPNDVRSICEELIAEWGFQEFANPILQATAPRILCLSHDDSRASGETGNTKIGGFPDLPVDLAWPTSRGGHLPFISQVNFSQLPTIPGSELPVSGRLYFFYLCAERLEESNVSVVWVPDPNVQLQRRVIPNKEILPDWRNTRVYDEEFHSRFYVAPSFSSVVAEEFAKAQGILQPDETIEDIRGGFPDLYCDHVESRLDCDNEDFVRGGRVDLLGYPDSPEISLFDCDPIENGYRFRNETWQNLLHVYSMNNMMWSDVGSLCFLIRLDDLKRRDFDHVMVDVLSS